MVVRELFCLSIKVQDFLFFGINDLISEPLQTSTNQSNGHLKSRGNLLIKEMIIFIPLDRKFITYDSVGKRILPCDVATPFPDDRKRAETWYGIEQNDQNVYSSNRQ